MRLSFFFFLFVSVEGFANVWPPLEPNVYEYRRDGVVTRSVDLCYGLPFLEPTGDPLPICLLTTEIPCAGDADCPGYLGRLCQNAGNAYADRCVGSRCVREYQLLADGNGTVRYCITGVRGEPSWPALRVMCPDCIIDMCALDRNICVVGPSAGPYYYDACKSTRSACIVGPRVCSYNTIECPSGQRCDKYTGQCTLIVPPPYLSYVTNGTETSRIDICNSNASRGFSYEADGSCVRPTTIPCSGAASQRCWNGANFSYVCNETRGTCDEVYAPTRLPETHLPSPNNKIFFSICNSFIAPRGYEISVCGNAGGQCAVWTEIWDGATMACYENGLPCDDGNAATADCCSADQTCIHVSGSGEECPPESDGPSPTLILSIVFAALFAIDASALVIVYATRARRYHY
jgi:hypothetical protein